MTDKPQDTEIDAKITAKLDRTDLNNEMAGIDTGKSWRFLSNNSPSNPHVRKKLETEREFRSMLDMLLAQDPHYAALYKKVTEKLDEARQAVNSALIDINQRLEGSDRKLQILRDNAAQLPDGTKVFQSNNGSIITEHGKRLSDEKAKYITFPQNTPKWEKYKAEKDIYDTAARQKEEVQNYRRDVLNPATRRMNDKNNPPSMDELKQIDKNIKSGMPSTVKSYFVDKDLTQKTSNTSSSSVAHDLVEETKLDVPDLSKSFDLARVDIPDLGNKLDNAATPTKTLG